MDKKDFLEEIINNFADIGHIKPEEFPNIDLYMDQVTTFMTEHLLNSEDIHDEKALTKTMINNYAKDNLLPPPVKKKYSRDHMIVLLYIYYLKNILSISDIQNIMNPLTERFFGKDKNADTDMYNIYSNIYDSVKNELGNISEDLTKKIQASEANFANVSNPEHKDFLQYFSIMCMLSYDIYAKKQLVERMIDSLFEKPVSKVEKKEAKDIAKQKEKANKTKEKKNSKPVN